MDLELSIGRELDNSLRLSDPSISRHHAVIRLTEAGHEIQDLGSSNGVLINGHRVQTALLQDGDRITLGQLQLTFVNPVAKATSPLGTVRLTQEDMTKLQVSAQLPPLPGTGITAEMHRPEPAPLAPPPPPPPPKAAAPWPPKVTLAPENPAPDFLRPFLPPVPDDAQPIDLGGTLERGDFLTRFVAMLIDHLPLLGVNLAIGLLTGGTGWLSGLLVTLVGLGYLAFLFWCTVAFRATVGKKAMKLRVVPEDDPTGNIDWAMAFLRFLGHVVSGCTGGLAYLLILGRNRKGLQDRFSRSIVIKVDR